MRLGPRLVLAFSAIAILSVAGLGAALREDRRNRETARFQNEVESACVRVMAEIERQAKRDSVLLDNACNAGELVDRALVALEADEMAERRLGFSSLVPRAREAFDLDELVLSTDKFDVLGADPRASGSVVQTRWGEVMKHLNVSVNYVKQIEWLLATGCKRTSHGHTVVLLGARKLAPLASRIGATVGAEVELDLGTAPNGAFASAKCKLVDSMKNEVPLRVRRSTGPLHVELARLDRSIAYAAMAAIGIALLFAVLLARSLGRPLSVLATEAEKVATGGAKPLALQAGGEVGALVTAFNRMLNDLGRAQRRVAVLNRVAAWREVARRVAHEVKNPLLPIRASIETLRRLRGRNDPAFDDYFDEATITVLDEVHRISNIVTEFTTFARLPAPKFESVDLAAVCKHCLTLQQAATPNIRYDLRLDRGAHIVSADRAQVTQVLLNLLKNAADALEGKADPHVLLALAMTGKSAVEITVSDNGPGIPDAFVGMLFEPYATTKKQGTGLGLAIAQRIAVEHGGELRYEPAWGSGAQFVLLLPLDRTPTSKSGPVSNLPST